MRRVILAAAIVVLAAACGGDAVLPSTTGLAPPTASSPEGSPSDSPSPSPSVEAAGVPERTPPSYDEDVEPSDVPPEALIPPGTAVTDVWYAETLDGSSIVIAYVDPGTDPFRQEHGLVVWRRFAGEPQPWRPVFGLVDPAARGVLQIRAVIGDATGDGSRDALTFEDTGGSGACGTWRVIDIAANVGVFKRKTCDTTIDLSADPAGLVVREAVFDEGDAHCCPSATKVSVLTFDEASRWTVYSTIERPT